MKIQKLLILLVLSISFLFFSIPSYADDNGSVIPQQETLLDEDPFEPGDMDSEEDHFETGDESFEADPFESEPFDSESGIVEDSGNSGSFRNDFKFIYSHKAALSTDDKEVIINRSQIRGEWEKLISPILFGRIDGSVSLYLPKDHIATAEDKDIIIDGSIREIYLQAGFEDFSLRFGKQIIVWGETDGGIINDVISPRDNSEFIFIDLEDSRIGQNMVSADIYSRLGEFQLFSILLPETDKNPKKRTRYDPGVFPANTVMVTREPEVLDFETGIKWKKTFNKFDFSLMAADLYMNEPVYTQKGAVIYEGYDKYFFIGTGASFTRSNPLFKLDVAYKKDYSLQAINATGYQGMKKDVLDTGIAVEFDANGKYTMNFELNNRHIFDYSNLLSVQDENSTGFYYLFGKKYLNEDLDFQYVFYYQIQESSAFHQVSLSYKLSDDLEIKGDYTHFNIIDEASALWNYRNEHRVGLEVKYYF